jgi:hypothetical protein
VFDRLCRRQHRKRCLRQCHVPPLFNLIKKTLKTKIAKKTSKTRQFLGFDRQTKISHGGLILIITSLFEQQNQIRGEKEREGERHRHLHRRNLELKGGVQFTAEIILESSISLELSCNVAFSPPTSFSLEPTQCFDVTSTTFCGCDDIGVGGNGRRCRLSSSTSRSSSSPRCRSSTPRRP